MANLKDLKNRIDSVKSTRKITSAMKMVAASKLRKAQTRAEASRPYAARMQRMLATLAQNADPETAPLLLTGRKGVSNTHLLIVATADRGLCGGFNSTIVRAVRKEVDKYEAQGKKVRILTIGRKGREQLKAGSARRFDMPDHVDTTKLRVIEYSVADTATDKILSLFHEEKIDSCSIVFNRFLSAISQKVTFQPLIPLDISTLGTEEPASASQAVYEYEPSEEAILNDLLPRNIAVQIYGALLENAASEQGARMTAMDNATRNAGEMIGKLTLQYNRTRQAAITTELTEIISGAEAL
ncbi:MAG: F0F1 ATP synthase subunit gamma [Hyphomicrobiales bacterium]|nr:F0F1 ATP synthase subunit gamma [Rickettsiales bacterium]MCP5361272.1 F0F1 ATP synthase subunit gamma [Hyphomicrobiales bacterium]